MKINEILREVRKREKINQVRLAIYFGYKSRLTVANWERKKGGIPKVVVNWVLERYFTN